MIGLARSDSSKSGRSYGSLDFLIDRESRGLRPIGESVRDVAERTSELFDALLNLPNVRLFRGVWISEADADLIPHAVCAGRQIILVDSVTWPPGSYTVAQLTGQVHCDGAYIGQSIKPLVSAITFWRDALPRHEVSALIVVHPDGRGGVGLRGPLPSELRWTLASDAVRELRGLLPSTSAPASRAAVTKLRAATGSPTVRADSQKASVKAA